MSNEDSVRFRQVYTLPEIGQMKEGTLREQWKHCRRNDPVCICRCVHPMIAGAPMEFCHAADRFALHTEDIFKNRLWGLEQPLKFAQMTEELKRLRGL